ncbi:hypothetical protein PWT90_06760 [Aphanocladium album]|nr:hypothetical protein PWT90_06760 [Aphanocladium album]
MHANLKLLDEDGDLIVVIHNPSDRELLANIDLCLLQNTSTSKSKKKMNSAERRRMRRRDMVKNDKPETETTNTACASELDSALEGEGLTSSLRSLEELTLAGDEGQADSATVNTTQTANISGSDEQAVARFRISSSVLRLASAQYRRSLSCAYPGTIKSQSLLEDGTTCDVVCMEEWDPNAFLIFLNILHGHYRQVPVSVNIDILGKLAALVDYYECHERVELFAKRWIQAMRGDLPDTYGEIVILWLAISWVFGDESIFKKMTEIVLKQSKCPFTADTLPLPPMLLSMLTLSTTHCQYAVIDIVQKT